MMMIRQYGLVVTSAASSTTACRPALTSVAVVLSRRTVHASAERSRSGCYSHAYAGYVAVRFCGSERSMRGLACPNCQFLELMWEHVKPIKKGVLVPLVEPVHGSAVSWPAQSTSSLPAAPELCQKSDWCTYARPTCYR